MPKMPFQHFQIHIMHIMFGVVSYPRLRMYGKPSTKIKYLDDIGISRNRFETLRNNLHIVDINEAHNPEDKLWKIRPLVNYFDKRCEELTIKEQLCIDESIIPFKGQLVVKQYIKGKPNS